MHALLISEYTVEVICADQAYFLTRLSECGVHVRDVLSIDQLRIRMKVSGRQYGNVRKICNILGCEIKLIHKKGIVARMHSLKMRLVLIISIAVLLFLTIFIPSRVFFVSVEGNERLDSSLILERAERAGLFWGASRKNIRSEKIKNNLLEAIPELKWVGINTYGCRAVISVVERAVQQGPFASNTGVQGVYAARDGIISSITVIKGTQLCKPGQAIKAGQLLISGYTDTGLITRAEQAAGEVCAITKHKVDAIAPVSTELRVRILERKTYWSLQVGKKRIKLYFDSGNYDARCGKIYKSIDWILPGGFQLPVSLVKETVLTYEYSVALEETDGDALHKLASAYIGGNMVGGQILSSDYTVSHEDGFCSYSGTYICNEMIGILKGEEIN